MLKVHRFILWGTLCVCLGMLRNATAETPTSQPQPTAQPTTQPSSRPVLQTQDVPNLDDKKQIEAALALDQKQNDPKARRDDAQSSFTKTMVRAYQSFNPDISLIADISLAYFSTKEPLQLGEHDPTRTGFNLQSLELVLGAAVDPYFRLDANIVFGEEGVDLEEVYGTTLALPFNFQARVGQFLTRFGRINATHPHSWFFVDQPMVLGKFFGGEGYRGLGGELSVLLPLPWFVELIGSVTGASGEENARSFFGAEDPVIEGLDDFAYLVALKQFVPLGENWSLAFGVSGTVGPNSTGRNHYTGIYGADLYLKYRPITHGSYTIVSLDVEWLLRRRQIPDDILKDHGLYAQLFYRFAKRWAIAARYEYVTGVTNDPLDADWTTVRQRVGGNITFWPSEFSRLRLQYQFDRPEFSEQYHVLVLAIELLIGKHGAHTF